MFDGLEVRLIDLKRILEKNRSKHRAEFEKALEGYRQSLIDHLEAQIDRIKNNKGAIRVAINLPVPEDHTRDYDRSLQMIELSLLAGQEKIVLDQHAAAQYVMDDWGWKDVFRTTSQFYGATS